MTGPGKVFLQTLPLSKLAGALAPYLQTEGSGNGRSGSGFNIGGTIGGLLDN